MKDLRDGELLIRPARHDDRAAMERICAQMWDGDDYVPEVWDEWLSSEHDAAFVGELDSTVVALSHIAFQTPEQAWLAGMRVEPASRKQGVAGQFLAFSLDYARRRGARVVRLGTLATNEPVHRLAALNNMRFVGSYVVWEAALEVGPEPCMSLTVLGEDDRDEILAFLQAGTVLDETHHLYSVDWHWQWLTEERLTEFLDEGNIWANRSPQGDLRAVVTTHPDRTGVDDDLWIGFAEGDREALLSLLAQASRRASAFPGVTCVRVMVPDLAWMRDTFSEAGFGPGTWEEELWIFEHRFDTGQPRGEDGADEI